MRLLLLLLIAHRAESYARTVGPVRPAVRMATVSIVGPVHPAVRMTAVSTAQREPVVQVLCASGLDEVQAQEVWDRRPAGRLPGIVQQSALIQWLQDGPLRGAKHPPRALHMALGGAPRLLLRAGKLPELKATLHALRTALAKLNQQQLSLTLAHNPEIMLLSTADVAARVDCLRTLASLDAEQLT